MNQEKSDQRRPAIGALATTPTSPNHSTPYGVRKSVSHADDALLERGEPMLHAILGTPGPLPDGVDELRTEIALARIAARRRRAAELAEQLAELAAQVRAA